MAKTPPVLVPESVAGRWQRGQALDPSDTSSVPWGAPVSTAPSCPHPCKGQERSPLPSSPLSPHPLGNGEPPRTAPPYHNSRDPPFGEGSAGGHRDGTGTDVCPGTAGEGATNSGLRSTTPGPTLAPLRSAPGRSRLSRRLPAPPRPGRGYKERRGRRRARGGGAAGAAGTGRLGGDGVGLGGARQEEREGGGPAP